MGILNKAPDPLEVGRATPAQPVITERNVIGPGVVMPYNLSSLQWTEVTAFQNSWVNFSTAEHNAAYMKDHLGFVHLRGLIKSGTIGTVAFTLPEGFRPSKHMHFAVPSNGAYGQLNVQPDGDVVPSAGNNAYVSLDGIRFDTR